MTSFIVTKGHPTEMEIAAIEAALTLHGKKNAITPQMKSSWGKPSLRAPLERKV